MFKAPCGVCGTLIRISKKDIPTLLTGICQSSEMICANCPKYTQPSFLSSCVVCNEFSLKHVEEEVQIMEIKKKSKSLPSTSSSLEFEFGFNRIRKILESSVKYRLRFRLFPSKAMIYGCVCSPSCLHMVRLACKPMDRVRSCRVCGLSYVRGIRSRFICQDCKGVNYCSKKCQKKDWVKHKWICTSIRQRNRHPHQDALQLSEGDYCNFYFVLRSLIRLTKGNVSSVMFWVEKTKSVHLKIDEEGDLCHSYPEKFLKKKIWSWLPTSSAKVYSMSSYSNPFGRYSGIWEFLLRRFGSPQPYYENKTLLEEKEWWGNTQKIDEPPGVDQNLEKIPKIPTATGLVGQEGIYLFKIDKEKDKLVYSDVHPDVTFYLVYLEQIHNIAFLCQGNKNDISDAPYCPCMPEKKIQFSFLCSIMNETNNLFFRFPIKPNLVSEVPYFSPFFFLSRIKANQKDPEKEKKSSKN